MKEQKQSNFTKAEKEYLNKLLKEINRKELPYLPITTKAEKEYLEKGIQKDNYVILTRDKSVCSTRGYVVSEWLYEDLSEQEKKDYTFYLPYTQSGKSYEYRLILLPELEDKEQDSVDTKLEQYVNYLNTLDKPFKGLSTEQDRTKLKTQYESGKYHKFHRTELNGGISEWVITEGNVEEFYLKSDINSFNCTYEYILLSTDELEETLRELESKMNKESIKINLKDTYCKATEDNLTKLRLDTYTSNIFTEHIGKGYFFVQDFENELHATFIDEASLSNGLINYFKRITLNKDNVWVYSEEPKTEPEQEPKQETNTLIKPESLTGTISQDKISEILVKAIGKDINDDSIKSIMYHTFKQDKVDIVITEKLDDEFETEVLYRVNHETLIKVIHEYLKNKGIAIVYTERHNKEEYHIWINEKESTISFRYNKTTKNIKEK